MVRGETMESIKKRAETIAEIITLTDTDDRGILFNEICDGLRKRAQFYTSVYFRKAADDYGYPQNSEPDTPNVKVRGCALAQSQRSEAERT